MEPDTETIQDDVQVTSNESFDLESIVEGGKLPEIEPLTPGDGPAKAVEFEKETKDEDENQEQVENKPAKKGVSTTTDGVKPSGSTAKPTGEAKDQNQEQPKTPPLKRDYSIFKPEDVRILKRLPNADFAVMSEKLKSVYKIESENTELKSKITDLQTQLTGKGIPQNWQEHPEAYKLSSEYQQVAATYNKANFEADHWRQQLINLKAGRPWYNIEKYDESGNPVFSAAIKSTDETKAEDEIALITAMNDAGRIKQDLINQAKSLQDNFRSSYTNAEQSVLKAEENYFAKLPQNLQPKNEQRQLFINTLPKIYQSHPLAKLSSSLFSLVINQATELKRINEKVNGNAAIKADIKAAGPKVKSQPTSKHQSGEVLDFEEIASEVES